MKRLGFALLALLISCQMRGQSSVSFKQSPNHIVSQSQAKSEKLPAGTHLNYYGGRVISNVQVVVVYWGSYVNGTVRAGMPAFYQGVTNSSYFDMLSEYTTNSASGTHQSIGRGSFLTGITINPSVTSSIITDAQIQGELTRQLSAGNLPQPKYDLAGNIDTLYMIYFPPGDVITVDGQYSCEQFCGYHGATLFNGTFVPYGVIPDLGPESGCHCGTGTTLENVMSVSSHELVESVTDAGVNQATALASPLAWYDPTWIDPVSGSTGAEIGDICNGQLASVPSPVGFITVQREFSNSAVACVYSGLHPELQLSGPTTVNPGSVFNLALEVNNPIKDQGHDTNFVGTVHFTSTDAFAVLPPDYTFTPADQGFHTFPVKLGQNGVQTVAATDTVNGAITSLYTLTSASAFSVTASPAVLTIPAETSANSALFTSVVDGLSKSVTFSLAGLPTGASSSFAPSVVSSGQSSTLTINTGWAAPGRYQLTVTASAAAEQHTVPISLTITDHFRAGNLLTTDSADRLSWTYEPNAVNLGYVEFKICKAPAITWWKEFVVRSGNFVFADFGVKNATACTSQQVPTSSLLHGYQMELWKAKFLGIPTQVKVMPSTLFGYLAAGSRITVTWLKD